MMDRRAFITVLAEIIFARPLTAKAQQPGSKIKQFAISPMELRRLADQSAPVSTDCRDDINGPERGQTVPHAPPRVTC